jgi:hypothetical protein
VTFDKQGGGVIAANWCWDWNNKLQAGGWRVKGEWQQNPQSLLESAACHLEAAFKFDMIL